MKRVKNSVKPNSNQRSISSFFTSGIPSPGIGASEQSGPCTPKLAQAKSADNKDKLPSLSSHQPAALKTECTPTKKRKRDTVKSPSPDVIPSTPPAINETTNLSKSCKKSSLTVRNSVTQDRCSPFKKNACGESNIALVMSSGNKRTEMSLNSQSKESSLVNRKKCQSQSPKKQFDNLNHLKSPSKDKNMCDKIGNPKKLMLSPIKTEEDEVLRSILEHLSPRKLISKVSDPQSKSTKSLFGSLSADKGFSVKQQREGQNHVGFSENSSVMKQTHNEKETSETPSKHKVRKSAQSPLGSDDSSALKYPPLPFGPKITKSEAYEKSTSNQSSTKPNGSINPVRRSPRKHPSSSPTDLQTVKAEAAGENASLLKCVEHGEDSGKENNMSSPSALRRSPRKHISTSALYRTSSECSPPMRQINQHSEKSKDALPPQNSQPPTASSDSKNEWDDLMDHDEYDQIMSIMAHIDELKPLDLSEAQLCEVMSIEIKIPSKEAILHVKSVENQSTTYCRVRGCWLACPVSEGTSISLEAVKVDGEWLLDSSQGFLVLHPDILISGTTVVGSLFCSRRSVLSSLFRGMDSDSPIMVIGSIIHELFQMVLQQEKCTEAEVKELSEQLITSKGCVRMLYAADMTVGQIKKELSTFIPRIVDFVGRFVEFPKVSQKRKSGMRLGAPCPSSAFKAPQTSRMNNQGKTWNGKIIGIRDIEETLWEPKLGIKGMVDVSVEVHGTHGTRKVMPLELKTGRASFSAEHRGQVTLYTMMMARLGQAVDSGLLLYLREGQIQEISVSHNERKDLIHLRNTLAHYLKPRAPIVNEETGRFLPSRFPEPISFKSACEKCPYSTLCSVYLRQDGLSDLHKDHPMVAISSSACEHLTQDHIEYVMHWVGLLLLEDTGHVQSAKLSPIWRYSPEEREKNRQAISNLCLKNSVEEVGGKYLHTFTRQAQSCNALARDLRETGLNSGDYILISTNKRVAVEHGNIIDIDSSSVKVSTNRNLYNRYAQETFHLDTSESNTVLVFNLTNLGCMLDNKESAERLRKIIIDRAVPSFTVRVEKSVIQDCLPIFGKLNKNQRNAVMRALRSDSHLLIKGLPGTGKTATMVALVQLLVRVGLSVLITSHTHSAVDNLLLRLKKCGLKFLRLGADARIHPQLHSYSESTLTKHCTTPEELDKVYSQQQIVGVTCLGAGHASLSRRTFDICLVDESTQVLQPSILRPLFCARRFVLVGDPDQLPPVVKSHQAQKLGLSESLFSRLDSEEATVSLTCNYRMNQVITELANGLTYEGKLMCGNSDVANATLQLTSQKSHERSWISTSLSTHISKAVVFADTSGISGKEVERKEVSSANPDVESSCCNHLEVSLVMELLNAFINSGVSCEEVGVMAPYRAQVSLLTQAIKSNAKLSDIEVNTVDQFQGRDKQVVVYSCTRSDGMSHSKPKDREILNDKRRLTVAITRAKHKLVLIGHSETLRLYAPFQKLLSCMSESNVISVDV